MIQNLHSLIKNLLTNQLEFLLHQALKKQLINQLRPTAKLMRQIVFLTYNKNRKKLKNQSNQTRMKIVMMKMMNDHSFMID